MCVSGLVCDAQKHPLKDASRPKLILAFGATIAAVMTAVWLVRTLRPST